MTTLAGRTVDEQAHETMARLKLGRLVSKVAAVVDRSVEPTTYRGGGIIYQVSMENPEDWEIVVVTRLAISSRERFDLSLRIGEDLNQAIAASPANTKWDRVTFRLELA